MENEVAILKELLRFPLWSSGKIFEKFKPIENSKTLKADLKDFYLLKATGKTRLF